ncbi:multisubstrate pseudouridine synthase 7 [Clydaea vesicula]|uniref:Multisubstrate pseudouridine synthase 7 n=1 Tax=Clydaea vesicula TaxID=447962 RepID=A0AAD5U7B3_9FUNG|nr:multisubstrate pseudouridine synthase 7 [Clydaea vesicula]
MEELKRKFLPSDPDLKPSTLKKSVRFGITCFVSQSKKPCALLKQSYQDFIVNEIHNGVVERLTDLNPPTSKFSSLSKEAFVEKLSMLIPKEEANTISNLKGSETHNISVILEEKSKRQQVHDLIKTFPPLASKTKEDKSIEIFFSKKQRINWKDLGGDYLEFLLYKENKDTADAINHISRLIGCSTKIFSFSGNKDRRAITLQKVTAYHVTAENLAQAVNKEGWLVPNDKRRGCIRVGNFSYCKNSLNLGDLDGNHFAITLSIRRVELGSESPEVFIREACESLQNNGFINYFGLQRFGVLDVSTHEIGVQILNGNYENAVNLIMKKKENEREDFTIAREHWEKNKNPKEALNLFPYSCVAERSILSYYIKVEDAFRTPMKALSNHMVSLRIKTYGMKLVVGDLVLIKEKSLHSSTTGGRNPQNVLILNEENLQKYSIKDLVLPLPGYDIIYPTNSIREEYKNFMAKDNIDYKGMKREERDFSLPGNYRYVFASVQNLKVTALSLNEMDIKNGLKVPDSEIGFLVSDLYINAFNLGGSKLAVVLEFDLNAACYATMVLREIAQCEELDKTEVYEGNDKKKPKHL